MNRKINRYVNYLMENKPSPFCEYILCKEIIKSDRKEIEDLYNWAKQFKLYKEIEKEQLPDGSWGGFDTWQTTLYPKSKFKATARAIGRLLDLSLDGIDDPMVNKVIGVMKKYLSGELPDPEHYGRENTGKPIAIRRQIIQNLGFFEPENNYVVELRNLIAEQFIKCCEQGYFNIEIWNSIDRLGNWGHGLLGMLPYGNVIDDDLQRMLLTHHWKTTGWTHPCDLKSPDDPWFIFWIVSLESLQNFSLFGEFMAEEAAPHLYNICERVINDKGNQMDIKINNYFYHHGQYTDTRNSIQKKKNDLLLQIIRILNKCEV